MLCLCGCGEEVKHSKRYSGKGYISGHNLRIHGCHVLTDEHKRKIGESHKGLPGTMTGRHHTEASKEKARQSNLGKKRSLESKKKMREAHLGIPHASRGKPRLNCRGPNHPNWKNGVTTENKKVRSSLEYKLWSRNVLEKSKFRCVRCERYANASHHIRNFASYPELRLDVDNGAALCKECHEIFHWMFGKKNTNEKQFAHLLLWRK